MGNPIAELVTAHCERTGDTLSDVAARGGLSRQTVSGLVHRDGPKSLPRGETLRGLAVGLGLPVEVVRQVAAESAYGEAANGHAPRRLVSVLISYAERLTDGDLEVLLATARALESAERS